MDAVLGLWLLGGALVAMLMMLVVVMVARTLDRDKEVEKAALAKLFSTANEAASKVKGAAGLHVLAGPVAALIAATSTDHKGADETEADAKKKQAKTGMTVLAIIGGVVMLIVGIITGDG